MIIRCAEPCGLCSFSILTIRGKAPCSPWKWLFRKLLAEPQARLRSNVECPVGDVAVASQPTFRTPLCWLAPGPRWWQLELKGART